MVIEEFSKKSSNKKVAVVVARLHSQGPDCLYRPESGRSDTGQSAAHKADLPDLVFHFHHSHPLPRVLRA